MKRIFKTFTILLMLVTILMNFTGCYDAKGIEELAYVVAIGLDISENDELELTFQFASSGLKGSSKGESAGASSQSKETTNTTVKCSSINSGISLINNHISKKANLSHCQVILISEKLAYNGISKYLDTFLDNTELKSNCNMIITKCRAKDYIANVNPALESLTARYYESSLKASNYTSYIVYVTLSEFYSRMKDTYSQAYALLGDVTPSNTNNSSVKINANYIAGENPIEDTDLIDNLGIAVFHGDKFVGELTGLDTICHSIVNNDLKECRLSIPSPFKSGNYLDLLLTSEKSPKISVSLINSSPLINVETSLVAYGLSLDENTSYSSEEALSLIQKYAEKYISDKISTYLYKTAKEYNSDICGFGKYAVTNYVTLNEWYDSNWLEKYKNSFFNVNVNVIVKSGNTFTKS